MKDILGYEMLRICVVLYINGLRKIKINKIFGSHSTAMLSH